MSRTWIKLALLFAAVAVRGGEHGTRFVVADDWPMLGRDGTRNAVSIEAGAPLLWNIEERNETQVTRDSNGIRWAARLGSQTHSSPVVSGGLVWIGTNSQHPGDNFQAINSVLKCFRVSDGKQVYEYVSQKLGPRVHDAGWTGLGSSPLIEGDRLWLMTNRSEVLCLDIGPLLRDEGPPRELWKQDLIKAFDVFVHVPLMGPPPTCSIGASWNGRIFVTINNGVDESRMKVPRPDAPSLVCLNKDNGEVIWKDNSPGANILLTQSASPTVAEIAGRVQVIVPQGDGWVRAFDPESGEKLWEFDINPKTSLYSLGGRAGRNWGLGNAVVYENHIYIASGRDAEQGAGSGRLVCIDPTKRGDVSSELAVDAKNRPLPIRRVQAVVVKDGEKAIPNPNSALVWEFVSCGKAIEDNMHCTMSSVAISKGLVIATDMEGLVHCLDAKSGKRHWRFDMVASIWCSPLIVDDKIYVADEDGEMAIFGLSADPNVAIQKNIGLDEPLSTIAMQQSILSSPSFANGVLYLATRSTLFAIAAENQKEHELKKTGGYWPQWRGPNRNNISTETGLLKKWPEGGPPLISRIEGVGEGIATVSIADNRIYTLGYFEKNEFVTALDQTTGERIWATRIGPRVPESTLMRLLSQRSPTVDDDRLYAFTSGGRLVCLQTRDGEELWSKSYPDDFGSPLPQWRFCDYPLVDGDKLICTPGGPQASIVALDKRTGKELWRSLVPDGGRSAYAALVVSEACGVKQYVAFLEKGLVGLRASDGQLLWSYNKIVDPRANSHTPIAIGDEILTGNGWGTGVALLRLSRPNDKFELQEQYFIKCDQDAFHDASIRLGDRFYVMGSSGILSCLNWQTGEKLWGPTRLEGRGKASSIFAEDRLYLRQADGRIALVEPSPTGYIERSHFSLPDHAASAGATFPVIAGGRLYLRDENNLFCYNIRADALQQPVMEPNLIALKAPAPIAEAEPKERTLRSVYVPTPQDIVEKMLKLAVIKKTDVVYDLGSGDGRIVIAAAQKYECHAVGYELDRELVESSRVKAKEANVAELVTIEHKDLFSADLSKADVVMLYLLPAQLEKLVPQLLKMKPGTRVVSHQFEIPGYQADLMVKPESTDDGIKHSLYVWTSPLKKTNNDGSE